MANTKVPERKLTKKNKRMIILAVICVLLVSTVSIILITHSKGNDAEKASSFRTAQSDDDEGPGSNGGGNRESSGEDTADTTFTSEFNPSDLYETAWVRESDSGKMVYVFNDIGDCYYAEGEGDSVMEMDGVWARSKFSDGQVIFTPYGQPEDYDDIKPLEGLYSIEITNNNTAIKMNGIEFKRDDYSRWTVYSMEGE